MSTLPFDRTARPEPSPDSSREPSPAVSSEQTAEARPRIAPNALAGLDVVRGWSAVGVVVLHACVPYADRPMPGLAWSTTDHTHPWISIVMWSIEVAIMPIFLVMAGFLAARSFAARGPWTTFRSRLIRLGKPLLLAMLVLLPLDLYVWLIGWVADGVLPPAKLRSLKMDGIVDRHLWGTSHLWFLQYLITYIALLAVFWQRRIPVRLGAMRSIRRRLQNAAAGPTVWLVLGASAVSVLAVAPQVVWGFQHSFWPVPSKWLYSGLFFLGGVTVWKRDPQLTVLAAQSRRWIGPAGCLLVAAVTLGLWHLDQGLIGEPLLFTLPSMTVLSNPLSQLTLAGLTVAAAWAVTMAIVGGCQRAIRRPSAVTAALAEASLLIYLLHHPLVGLTHVSLKHAGADLPLLVKWLVASCLGVALPLAAHRLATGRFRAAVVRERDVPPAILPISHEDGPVTAPLRRAS